MVFGSSITDNTLRYLRNNTVAFSNVIKMYGRPAKLLRLKSSTANTSDKSDIVDIYSTMYKNAQVSFNPQRLDTYDSYDISVLLLPESQNKLDMKYDENMSVVLSVRVLDNHIKYSCNRGDLIIIDSFEYRYYYEISETPTSYEDLYYTVDIKYIKKELIND